jgi:LAS superfamily LD-carboxypeptidase LdcB
VTTSRRRSRAARLLAAALVAATPVLVPSVSGAGPGQQGPTTQRDDVGSPASQPDDDVLRATSSDVVTSLDDLSTEVQAQVTAVVTARDAEATAAAELEAADAAVTETQGVIDRLTVRSDEVVVEAFINPPSENAMETLSADSLADATVKQSILTSQTNANAEVLTALQAAQDDLATQMDAQDEAATAAEDRAAEAESALTDLVSSQSDETLFVLAVQDRLASSLAEADALAGIDPAAAEAIRLREGEIAAKIDSIVSAREQRAAEAALQQAMAEAAAQAAANAATRSSGSGSSSSSGGGASLGPATGSLSTVSCPGGGSITVDSSLAGSLQSMLDAAAADGNNLCGGGYRDPSAQIALRRSNCGTSDYAIYEAPSSACSPPTARPGTSNHEQGLAIDFTCNGGGALGRSSSCFSWLQNNAASYGLYNLPSEPWHWSNDGT